MNLYQQCTVRIGGAADQYVIPLSKVLISPAAKLNVDVDPQMNASRPQAIIKTNDDFIHLMEHTWADLQTVCAAPCVAQFTQC